MVELLNLSRYSIRVDAYINLIKQTSHVSAWLARDIFIYTDWRLY